MHNKTIGVIGGFGPEGTAEFYMRLVAKHRALHHGRQPNILIRNVAVPRHLEKELLVRGKSIEKFAPLLTAAASELERSGVGLIVLPCNTLHVHEQAIRSAITVPFVSIIKTTVQFLKQNNIRHVGFLGSRVTIKQNLFRNSTDNITFITVPKIMQNIIDRGLDQFVGQQDGKQLKIALAKAFTFLTEQNVHDVLLACTDFQTLIPHNHNIQIHDTLNILVGATVDMV